MIYDEKNQIRQQIRRLRRQLAPEQQHQAAIELGHKVKQRTIEDKAKRVALFFSMDGEVGTQSAIDELWQHAIEVYLPVIHPFSPNHLVFVRYRQDTPLFRSRLGMLEPAVECHHLCPISKLDILFIPLVGFDISGNRLGMGGGFYDRTLEPLLSTPEKGPDIIGLAHDCQQIPKVPIEPWDVPLKEIITPSTHFRFA